MAYIKKGFTNECTIGLNGTLSRIADNSVWLSAIEPINKKRLYCEYCGCISEKEHGTCEHCGAPLKEMDE